MDIAMIQFHSFIFICACLLDSLFCIVIVQDEHLAKIGIALSEPSAIIDLSDYRHKERFYENRNGRIFTLFLASAH